MSHLEPHFSHRDNIDGTVDSICRYCFRTVGTAFSETALALQEEAHFCDPEERARFQQVPQSDPPGPYS